MRRSHGNTGERSSPDPELEAAMRHVRLVGEQLDLASALDDGAAAISKIVHLGRHLVEGEEALVGRAGCPLPARLHQGCHGV